MQVSKIRAMVQMASRVPHTALTCVYCWDIAYHFDQEA